MTKNSSIRIAIWAALLITLNANAAGFGLIEQNASGMGNAYAGAAAVAEDASTIFFNPAGMSYIQGTQAVGALHFIKPNAEFNNNGSASANFRALGEEGSNAGDLALIPNLYLMTEINPNIKIGVGVNAPFGLKTEYGDEWLGRFQADKSEVKTININPSIAFKMNDQLSLGFGVSAMRTEATLTRAVNFGSFGEGNVHVKGNDWGFGYNFGLIYQATPATRIGVAYRSKVNQHLDGDVKFSRPAGLPAPLVNATPNGGVNADVTLPESASLSTLSQLNTQWDLLGDITWTRWSQFKELRIMRDNGATLSVTPENWENTLRYSLGLNYHYSDAIKLRAGVAYDQEAIKDEYRTARIPGNDRKWLSLGAAYQFDSISKLDIGYAHLFISDAKIDDNQLAVSASAPFNSGQVKGNYDGSVDILSMQYTRTF